MLFRVFHRPAGENVHRLGLRLPPVPGGRRHVRIPETMAMDRGCRRPDFRFRAHCLLSTERDVCKVSLGTTTLTNGLRTDDGTMGADYIRNLPPLGKKHLAAPPVGCESVNRLTSSVGGRKQTTFPGSYDSVTRNRVWAFVVNANGNARSGSSNFTLSYAARARYCYPLTTPSSFLATYEATLRATAKARKKTISRVVRARSLITT